MTDDTETNATPDEQLPGDVTNDLLGRDDGEEIDLALDDGTEIRVSVIRSLHLPNSVDDDIEGGSLRHAVRANEQAAERLDLPSREGLIAAEERDPGSWTRPRIGFYDLVTVTDDEGDEYDDYGDLQRTNEIAAVNGD